VYELEHEIWPDSAPEWYGHARSCPECYPPSAEPNQPAPAVVTLAPAPVAVQAPAVRVGDQVEVIRPTRDPLGFGRVGEMVSVEGGVYLVEMPPDPRQVYGHRPRVAALEVRLVQRASRQERRTDHGTSQAMATPSSTAVGSTMPSLPPAYVPHRGPCDLRDALGTLAIWASMLSALTTVVS